MILFQGITPQEPSFVKSVGQVTASTQTESPGVSARKTYVAILKSVSAKGESGAASTAPRIVTEPLKFVESSKHLPIAPRPGKVVVSKPVVVSNDEVKIRVENATVSSPKKSVQKMRVVPQKATASPRKLSTFIKKATVSQQTPPQKFHTVPQKGISVSQQRDLHPQHVAVNNASITTGNKYPCSKTPEPFDSPKSSTELPFDIFSDTPLTNAMDESMEDDMNFNWEGFLEPIKPNLLCPDVPFSLGSPDSGVGSDIIGSDIANSDECMSDFPFSSDSLLDSLCSDDDPSLVSVSKAPMDFESNDFLSEFLTF